MPSRTPTSISSSSDGSDLFSFVPACSFAPGVVRARFGAARFGRSGVGLRSIDSSLFTEAFTETGESSSSTSKRRLFDLCKGEAVKVPWFSEEASWWRERGLARLVVGVVCHPEELWPRPNPKPNGEGAWATGKGANSIWWCITFAIVMTKCKCRKNERSRGRREVGS